MYIYIYLHVPARAQINTFMISCTMLEFWREMARHVRDFETSGSTQKKNKKTNYPWKPGFAMFLADFSDL